MVEQRVGIRGCVKEKVCLSVYMVPIGIVGLAIGTG